MSATAMTDAPCTVLCVDDEPNILLALERVLRRSGVRVLTAPGGAEALALMEAQPVDVLLSDMRMPGMDGAQLLSTAHARWPDTVRLLLTGHSDHEATVRSINGGRVYGYLAKPWDADDLRATVARAAELARLTREKARLEALTQSQNDALRTLNAELETRVEARTAELSTAHGRLKRSYMTSIKVFANLLELRSGSLMGHGRRVADLARRIAQAMGCDDELVQQIFVAGLLHDIGLVGLSDVALALPVARLSPEQMAQYRRHASVGEQSLLAIDELQPVAQLIRSHHERYDGQGFPDALAGEGIALGARILAVADAHDELLSGSFGVPGLSPADVRVLMERGRGTQYDPSALDVLLRLTQQPETRKAAPPMMVLWAQLKPGMVLAADFITGEGVLLLTAGHVLTEDLIHRIAGYARHEGQTLRLAIRPGSLEALGLRVG